MAPRNLNTQKFRLSTITLFLSDYITRFSKTNVHSTLGFEKYYDKLWTLIKGYNEIILDEKGTILTWNNDFRKIKGYADPEIIGQSINMFYLPQERQAKLPEKLL